MTRASVGAGIDNAQAPPARLPERPQTPVRAPAQRRCSITWRRRCRYFSTSAGARKKCGMVALFTFRARAQAFPGASPADTGTRPVLHESIRELPSFSIFELVASSCIEFQICLPFKNIRSISLFHAFPFSHHHSFALAPTHHSALRPGPMARDRVAPLHPGRQPGRRARRRFLRRPQPQPAVPAAQPENELEPGCRGRLGTAALPLLRPKRFLNTAWPYRDGTLKVNLFSPDGSELVATPGFCLAAHAEPHLSTTSPPEHSRWVAGGGKQRFLLYRCAMSENCF